MFDVYNYSKTKKVQLATIEFTNYVSTWWDQLVKSRRRYDEPPVSSWREIKTIMRKRFIPSHYSKDLHRRLHTLKQRSMSIDEYSKEMKMLMIRADVHKDDELTMARFLDGLNPKIVVVVELHNYAELKDLMEKAEKVER